MAMSRRGRDSAEWAIRCARPFRNSTGSMSGTRGPARELGWLSSHEDKSRIKELLGQADYVVWSYSTPIGFVVGDEKYYVEEHHTTTTSHHQGILKVSWGEYEVIGERRPARRRPAPPPRYDDGSRPGARANAVVQGYAEAAQREPTAAHAYSAAARLGSSADAYSQAPREQGYMSPRERAGTRFDAQDDLMDEVRGYTHPAHP